VVLWKSSHSVSVCGLQKSQKLYLQPVGKYYFVATLLNNMHTCVASSVTGSFFKINPPSLSEYLSFTSGDYIEQYKQILIFRLQIEEELRTTRKLATS
jgi:hypothetical protein